MGSLSKYFIDINTLLGIRWSRKGQPIFSQKLGLPWHLKLSFSATYVFSCKVANFYVNPQQYAVNTPYAQFTLHNLNKYSRFETSGRQSLQLTKQAVFVFNYSASGNAPHSRTFEEELDL